MVFTFITSPFISLAMLAQSRAQWRGLRRSRVIFKKMHLMHRQNFNSIDFTLYSALTKLLWCSNSSYCNANITSVLFFKHLKCYFLASVVFHHHTWQLEAEHVYLLTFLLFNFWTSKAWKIDFLFLCDPILSQVTSFALKIKHFIGVFCNKSNLNSTDPALVLVKHFL